MKQEMLEKRGGMHPERPLIYDSMGTYSYKVGETAGGVAAAETRIPWSPNGPDGH